MKCSPSTVLLAFALCSCGATHATTADGLLCVVPANTDSATTKVHQNEVEDNCYGDSYEDSRPTVTLGENKPVHFAVYFPTRDDFISKVEGRCRVRRDGNTLTVTASAKWSVESDREYDRFYFVATVCKSEPLPAGSYQVHFADESAELVVPAKLRGGFLAGSENSITVEVMEPAIE
jgi:hypothetical protein